MTTTTDITAGAGELVERKRRFLFPNLYHLYQQPPELVRGRGCRVWDRAGRSYLDCLAGVSVLAVGHCHPDVAAAVHRQVDELWHTTTLFLTRPMIELAERLTAYAPASLTRAFFVASGSEAVEGAVLSAQLATGRYELIALDGGLHGRTKLGMSLTGLGFWRADAQPVGGIHHVPSPHCYRCPLKLSYPSCGIACADEVERAVTARTSGKVAAFVAEPVQGNGGVVVPPPEYFPRVREILDRHGILFVADEVQTGFGRTGRRFALEHWGIEPDLMAVAKALGGGLPIGAFLAREEIAQTFDRPSASTWGGNPVSCAAALAVLHVLERERLVEKSAATGERFLTRLRGLAEQRPEIGDVRGLGLMLGAEVVDGAGEPDPRRTDRVLEALKDDGVLAGKCGPGRNVLLFQPPLAIGTAEVDEVADRLEHALAATEGAV